MIIDQSRLAGLDAYLRHPDTPESVNLGGQSPRTGRTQDLGDGLQLDVSGIRLTIEADDLIALFARSSTGASRPLLSISIVKEVFPGLFVDPFRHRVHTIAGFEDFQRGVATNCRAMEVEGTPTVVSIGPETMTWVSPIYPMPAATRLSAAAWDIASVRRTAPGAFRYSIALEVWSDPPQNDDEPATRTIRLVDDASPVDPRFTDELLSEFTDPGTDDPALVAAYRLTFTATVSRDALLSERHVPVLGESLGRPLLRAVHLLEPITSMYDISSLAELLRHCSDYYLPEVSDGVVTHMTATLDLDAALVRGATQSEFLEIAVRHDGFTTFEAMLEANVLVRPPRR
jgi:hypothetical protein